MFLAIPVTSAVAERSFSTLKRIKTWLRNTMGQEKLNSLSILNIEKQLLSHINFNNVIKRWAEKDGRLTQYFPCTWLEEKAKELFAQNLFLL